MDKINIVLVLSFIFMISGLTFMAYSFVANAERGEEFIPETTAHFKTWKNFEDGVTFYLEDKSSFGVRNIDTGIYVDGKKIQCDNPMFMHGGLLDPECVEAILRHELDRRGL
jgi:hypothetical protein